MQVLHFAKCQPIVKLSFIDVKITEVITKNL